MQFTPKNSIKRFQQGGPVDVEEPMTEEAMPVEEAPQQDPMAMLIEGAAQALQNQDCNIAMQVCQALVQIAQQGAQPAPEETGEPVFKKGGVLLRRVRK